jgi:hypothetical protein
MEVGTELRDPRVLASETVYMPCKKRGVVLSACCSMGHRVGVGDLGTMSLPPGFGGMECH